MQRELINGSQDSTAKCCFHITNFPFIISRRSSFLFTHKRTIICKMCDYFVPSKRSNQPLPITSMWLSDGRRHRLDFCEGSKEMLKQMEEVWGECDDKLLIWSVFKLHSWTKPDSLWRKRQPRVDLRLGWMDGWYHTWTNECVCVWMRKP